MGAAMVSGSTGDYVRGCAPATGASDTLRPGCTMRDGQGPEQLYLTATCPGGRAFTATGAPARIELHNRPRLRLPCLLAAVPTPEQIARTAIDAALERAGWVVQDFGALNLHAAVGVAVREFPLGKAFGAADYLLYVHGQAVGVIEAKKEGDTLAGVEVQAEKHAAGVPAYLPAPVRPLPLRDGLHPLVMRTSFTERRTDLRLISRRASTSNMRNPA